MIRALLLVLALFAAAPAFAQTQPFNDAQGNRYTGYVLMCWNGTVFVPCSATGGAGTPQSTTSADYTTEPAGTPSPLGVPVQGMGPGSLPISQPDAGNRADGNGTNSCASACNGTALANPGDTSSFGGGQVTIHITAFSGTATLTPQDSDDNANFFTAAHCWQSNAGDSLVTTITAAGAYTCNIEKRYFRLQYTAYTSGTQTAFWDMRHFPYFPTPSLAPQATTALAATLVAKASAGNLYGFNCTAIAGAAAGFCIGYNATSCPTNGSAVTGSLVLDVCSFDTTNKGCSLSRSGGPSRRYSAGISICMTTATSPYGNMASATDTGAISADVQ